MHIYHIHTYPIHIYIHITYVLHTHKHFRRFSCPGQKAISASPWLSLCSLVSILHGMVSPHGSPLQPFSTSGVLTRFTLAVLGWPQQPNVPLWPDSAWPSDFLFSLLQPCLLHLSCCSPNMPRTSLGLGQLWGKECLGTAKQRPQSQIVDPSWRPVFCWRQFFSLLSLCPAFFLSDLLSLGISRQLFLSMFCLWQHSKWLSLAILKNSLDSSPLSDYKPGLSFYLPIQSFTSGFLWFS